MPGGRDLKALVVAVRWASGRGREGNHGGVTKVMK